MPRFFQFPLRWMVCFLAITAPLRALEIEQTLWGFNGKVVPGCFNPLSVLVSNPGSAPFDGALVLAPETIGGNAEGADHVQPIFLAPRASRWVQFYVYTANGLGSHVLRWGRSAKETYELDDPVQNGPPACVWLRDMESPLAAAVKMKTFPDQLFPTVAAAAEGLDAVVLDHTPRWEPARREAFLDWVRLGGTVHLLPNADGHMPVFGEGLEALDTQQDETRLGRGRVVHHQMPLQEMSETYLATHGFPARTIENTKQPLIYDFEGTLFRNLSSVTRPNVNWSLIYLLVIAYVAVIGPLHNYYRRRLDYRVSIAAFLGCVSVFAFGLGMVGRRGYGESQTVHSLAIARGMGGGRADVTQWISAFATAGDRYTLTHRAAANLYATDRLAESGSSTIFNGKDGSISLDIPLYSSRTFIHRAIMTGDDTSVTVEKWETAGSTLRALRLRTAAGFPAHPQEMRAVHGGTVYELDLHDGTLELSKKPTRPLHDYLPNNPQGAQIYNGGTYFGSQNPVALMPALAARALYAPGIFPDILSPPAPKPDLQLLIVAPAPPSFRLQGHGFTHENGWVLYVEDVFKP